MKSNILLKGVLGALLIGGMASCSDDYLDTVPKTNIDTSTASSSVKGAELALNGICRSMYMQYGNISTTPNFNGEPYIAMTYGEMQGPDDFLYVWCGRFGVEFSNWVNNTQYNGIMPAYAWRYCYNLIAEANNILIGEETAVGDVNDRKNIMAQVLTLRAHAYFRLLQLYAPRWEDSNNGEIKCLPLRLKPTLSDLACSTMNEVLDQIYADLDKAIQYFTESKAAKSTLTWRPNIDVARGIYARVAMLKHDYTKAQQMAHDARQAYPLMTASEYADQGFQPTAGWMWYNGAELTGIYYWAFGSWYACNGPYTEKWGFGSGAINYDLYKMIPENDVRRKMYLTPEGLDANGITAPKRRFWDPNGGCNVTNMNVQWKNGALISGIQDMNKARTPEGFRAPYNQDTEGDFIVPFGAQYKFWGTDTYGTNSMPFMRAEEMLLTEAEAAYHNNQPGVAQSCLNELYAVRNPGQTCTLAGEDLLNEIRTQRRIELWGEGFCWFDFKRWNLPVERKPWIANDQSSNNIPPQFKMTKSVRNPGWRLVIPQSETTYNKAIRLEELGYTTSEE